MGSVQTEAQYVYVHRALLGYLRYLGYISDSQLHQFHLEYNAYLNILDNVHKATPEKLPSPTKLNA